MQQTREVVEVVWHFSEDPGIEVFEPRPDGAAPAGEAWVWAIDGEHAPAYWFPRECPRVTFWRGPEPPAPLGVTLLAGSTADRVHAIEWAWLDRLVSTTLYGYAFDAGAFTPWPNADGYRVAREPVRPCRMERIDDLLGRHRQAGVEVRLVPTLWPLVAAVVDSGLRFSVIRSRNATPR